MTLEGLRKNLVEERQVYTQKELSKFCRNLFLSCLTFGGTTVFVVACTISVPFSAFIALLFGLLYLWILDYCVEDDNFRNRVQSFSKLWFLGIIAFVAIYVCFKYFGFY